MAGTREGVLGHHPLDLTQCIRNLRPTPKGKKVHVHMQAVRHSKASIPGHTGKEGLQHAMAFIFCAEEAATPFSAQSMNARDEEKFEHGEEKRSRFDSIGGVQLPPFEYANLGLLLPAAWAAQSGLLLPAGAACACLPIMAPFQIPQVSPDSWMANKRALAFNRCVVLGVYAQGGLAILKFSGGDLVGGTYLALQAAMGAYSITPDGARLMPSYMMVSGFNGLLGIIQVFQSFQGVPLHHIPWMAILPPAIGLLTCYWGWQFCKELQAIGSGMAGSGPQDTCWVKFMGGDIWPISSLSPTVQTDRRERDGDESVMGATSQSGIGGVSSRFSAFGGSGHRLGEGGTMS